MVSQFDINKLFEHLEQAAVNLDEIHYLHFADAMLEFSNSFAFLGRALSMAFSDITSKAAIIKNNFQGSQFTGLQSMISDEIRRGVERFHQDDHHASTARTILRLMWFFDFLRQLIINFSTHLDWKMSKCVSEAYDDAFGPHHPWPVRMAAKVGIKTVPNREEYGRRLLGDISLERQLELFNRMLELSSPIREALWNFYKRNNLTELP
ncbi:unnamed protein product [Blepharisma stoltei]|uniref:Glycolipid transfer protein domain-containing protein n=1 Tax=Blepharisma stoltei TaxID=1481888 RepID=A0AAU9JKW7_9CILI|nr:unnamed protein product [Blepharisma stoltei]